MDPQSNADGSWFILSENEFSEFTTSIDNSQLSNSLLTIETNVQPTLCPSKWKVIKELVYQSLYFCKERKILFAGAKLLIELIEQELKYLSREPGTSSQSESPLQRMSRKVSEATQAGTVPIATVKSVLEFFSERFLKNVEAYRYVLHHFPDEIDAVVCLEVQTPMIPLPLSSGTAP